MAKLKRKMHGLPDRRTASEIEQFQFHCAFCNQFRKKGENYIFNKATSPEDFNLYNFLNVKDISFVNFGILFDYFVILLPRLLRFLILKAVTIMDVIRRIKHQYPVIWSIYYPTIISKIYKSYSNWFNIGSLIQSNYHSAETFQSTCVWKLSYVIQVWDIVWKDHK